MCFRGFDPCLSSVYNGNTSSKEHQKNISQKSALEELNLEEKGTFRQRRNKESGSVIVSG